MRLLFLLLAVFPLAGQVIEGSVANALTGAPLDGVSVTIESQGRPAYQTTTDVRGAFHLDSVKPGTYRASFSKTEFLPLEPKSPARRPFTVASGSGSVHLEANLTPLGKICGRVLDANGDPISNAEVLLDSSQMGKSATSDKEGNFSFQVTPGRYTLLAKPPQEMKPLEKGEKERFGWVPTYYPGTPDAHAAAPIVAGPGTELWGNDIRIRAVSLQRVRGIVLDTRGDPAPKVLVRTARTDDTLSEDLATVSAEDGSFEFPRLYDGEWSIFGEKDAGGVKLKAFSSVFIGDRDMEGLELHLKSPFTLRGNVSFGGASRPQGKLEIFLRPAVIAGSQGLNLATVDRDGVFKIDNVYPGTYKIVALSPGPPFFSSSIKMGDRDVLGQSVEFYPGALPIQVVFESKGGAIRGTVSDCGSATVVVAPQDRALQEAQFVQTAKCSDGSRFEFANLRPGDYYAFAFDQWDGPLDLLSRLDQSLINKSVSVRVNQGESAVLDLRIIPREP